MSFTNTEMSSYAVFLSFVKESGEAEDIISKQCYQRWIGSRRSMPKKPQEAFRRALTAHCRGVDGRRPFPEPVEQSLLKALRQKRQWPCFEGAGSTSVVGIRGFPSLGFHESKKQAQPEQTAKLSKPIRQFTADDTILTQGLIHQEVERIQQQLAIWQEVQDELLRQLQAFLLLKQNY